jgi:hypothetical protein
METIETLAHLLFQIFTFATAYTSGSLKYLLQKPQRLPQPAIYWRASPNIFILRHSNQQWLASKNQDVNSKMIAMILAASTTSPAGARTFSPTNSRLFEDYGCYVTQYASLWIWSGVSAHSKQDEGAGTSLVFEHQVLMEIIDYGYMLHRLLLFKCSKLSSYHDVLDIRSEIVDLKQRLREQTQFGELRALLSDSWSRMGLEELHQLIKETIEIRGLRLQHLASMRNQRSQLALAIFGLLFSVLAVNPTVDSLWKLTGLPQFGPPVVFSLAISAMSILVIIALVLLIQYVLEILKGESVT